MFKTLFPATSSNILFSYNTNRVLKTEEKNLKGYLEQQKSNKFIKKLFGWFELCLLQNILQKKEKDVCP